jgi:hypothetical protein
VENRADAGKISIKFKRTLEKFDGDKKPGQLPVETLVDEWEERFPSMEAARAYLSRLVQLQPVSDLVEDNIHGTDDGV